MEYSEIDLWVSIEQILTPDEFRVFEMRYRFQMNQEQIAEIMQCTQQLISYHLPNILKKLQSLL